MMAVDLDISLLRTFVLGVESGRFSEAADRVGRSASAVSLQMRRLEAQVGARLLERQGRRVVPTAEGERFLGYARGILRLNDEAIEAFRTDRLSGVLRVGFPEDFALSLMPSLLSDFSKTYPKVRLTVSIDASPALAGAFRRGELDCALTWPLDDGPQGVILRRYQLSWIARRSFAAVSGPFRLVALPAPCSFRKAAIGALDRSGRAFSEPCATTSLAGVWAAVAGGLGVTARIREFIPAGRPELVAVAGGDLPPLPAQDLTLHTAETGETGPAGLFAGMLKRAISGAATRTGEFADGFVPLA